MRANYIVITKGEDNAVEEQRYHGIGAIDCEFENFWDVVNHYTEKLDKLPIKISDNVFMWEDSESWIYLSLEDAFKYGVGRYVRSNNNISPIKFGRSQIVDKYLMNYNPFYVVRLPDGTIRDCRECDLIDCIVQTTF